MSFDFDQDISRTNTSSLKWDARANFFGREDVIPLWVADMDFAAAPVISDALKLRAAHPVYGYSQFADDLFEALINWQQRRHHWHIRREWVVMAPGVVPTLHAAILAFSQPGDAVIVQPPVYFEFMSSVTQTGRKLVFNPLKLEHGRYRFDLDHLERCAHAGARLLILCSPHNPVGRVWERPELDDLLSLARRYKLMILSDEVHADLLYPGYQHIPLATMAEKTDQVITAIAPSKSFNIPGLGLSAIVASSASHRAAINKALDLLHVSMTNPFSMTAFTTAYQAGEPWLNALMSYLAETRDCVRQFLQEHLPSLHLIEPEATYLLWLDCRCLAMDDKQLERFFVNEAAVALSPGSLFGMGGGGFMRINIGTPRKRVMKALEQIAWALKRRAQ